MINVSPLDAYLILLTVIALLWVISKLSGKEGKP